MNTGHDGSLTTLHANTPRDALARLLHGKPDRRLRIPSFACMDSAGTKYLWHVQIILIAFYIAFPMLPTPPGHSARCGPSQGVTRIERAFLGSHSDIGGGFPDGDLAKVALVWMVDQATLAGVNMDEPNRTIIPNPVIHDKSSNLFAGAPTGGPTTWSEDRDVRYADGSVVRQRQTMDQGMTYADTVSYMSYTPNPNAADHISGTVDMQAYLNWLNANGYNINITVQ